MTRLAQLWWRAENAAAASTRTDVGSLGIARVVYGVTYLAIVTPSFSWMSGLPDAFYTPPGLSLGLLVDGFPPDWVLHLLDAVVVIGAVAVTLGARTRTSCLVLFAAVLIGKHFEYGFGKIGHDFLVHVVLLVMAWSPWGEAFSIDAWWARRNGRAVPPRDRPADLRLLGLLVAFAFFTAAFGKAQHWIDFDPSTGGTLRWLYVSYYSPAEPLFLADVALALRPLWLWEIADVLAVVFELSAVVALVVSRRTWIGWLGVACAFHLITALLLNIPFYRHAALYPIFIPWSVVVPPSLVARAAALGQRGRRAAQRLAVAVLVTTLAVLVGLKVGGGPDRGAVFALADDVETFRVRVGVVAWSLALAVMVAVSFRLRTRDRHHVEGSVDQLVDGGVVVSQ